jgi:ferrous iron transport protein B
MVDLAQQRGLSLDPVKLSAHLGCPVVAVVARRGIGLDGVRTSLGNVLRQRAPRVAAVPADSADARDLMGWAEHIVEDSVGGASAVGSGGDTLTERLDKTFTHPVLGLLLFAGVMVGLFYTLFALATLPMDLIEATFARLGEIAGRVIPEGLVHDLVSQGIIGGIAGTVVFLPQICLLFFLISLPEGAVRRLATDGVIGGIAGTVVFLPQIMLLFFLISLLEDTGYLARAAFVMDRLLCRFGLPGHAFVPLLTSHACALPGIMSTRLIPDRRDRFATILVAPFMSCSARLPVYVLLTSLLFTGQPLFAGLAFAACYALGASAALGSALLFRRTLLRGEARPMILELPSYKSPSLRNALVAAKDQGLAFLKTAGTAIMAICIVMWWLNTFPRVGPTPEADALRVQAEAAADPAQAETFRANARLIDQRAAQAGSFAGRLGQTLQPAFAPLGFDWQLTVGVLTSFLAREVFVSTMSVLVGDANDDVTDQGVIARIRAATREDGSLVFTPATATSLLIFFVLAMQCLPTLAVTRRETGHVQWAALQLGYMTTLAYVFAFVAYQGLRLAGVS